MAQHFSAAAEVECWKQHTCVGCHATFRYLLRRRLTRWGVSRSAATRAARHAAAIAKRKEVDAHPCPVCGLYQPDMVGARRARMHGWICAIFGLSLGVILGVALQGWLILHLSAWALSAVCTLALVGLLAVEWWNPNRNLERNHRLAGILLESRKLEVVSQGDGLGQPFPRRRFSRTIWHYGGYLLLLLLPPLALTPELLRLGNGWPLNPQWSPPVAGPGDWTHMDFGAKLSSVRGMWNGSALARVVNWQELGLPESRLQTTTNTDHWDGIIFARSGEKDQSSGPLWVSILVPREKTLEGKTLQVEVQLRAAFPVLVSEGQYADRERDFQRTLDLHVATPGSADLYLRTWSAGAVGASGLLLLVGLLFRHLAQMLRKRALPVSSISLQEEDDPDMPEWVKAGEE